MRISFKKIAQICQRCMNLALEIFENSNSKENSSLKRDTDFNKKIILKPKNIEESKEQLRQLSGKTHKLITATVCVLNNKKVWSYVSEQNMKMRLFSDNFIDGYISKMKDNILSIVGGYEIEGLGINLFDEIGDDLFSIQGISILNLLNYLRKMDYIE